MPALPGCVAVTLLAASLTAPAPPLTHREAPPPLQKQAPPALSYTWEHVDALSAFPQCRALAINAAEDVIANCGTDTNILVRGGRVEAPPPLPAGSKPGAVLVPWRINDAGMVAGLLAPYRESGTDTRMDGNPARWRPGGPVQVAALTLSNNSHPVPSGVRPIQDLNSAGQVLITGRTNDTSGRAHDAASWLWGVTGEPVQVRATLPATSPGGRPAVADVLGMALSETGTLVGYVPGSDNQPLHPVIGEGSDARVLSVANAGPLKTSACGISLDGSTVVTVQSEKFWCHDGTVGLLGRDGGVVTPTGAQQRSGGRLITTRDGHVVLPRGITDGVWSAGISNLVTGPEREGAGTLDPTSLIIADATRDGVLFATGTVDGRRRPLVLHPHERPAAASRLGSMRWTPLAHLSAGQRCRGIDRTSHGDTLLRCGKEDREQFIALIDGAEVPLRTTGTREIIPGKIRRLTTPTGSVVEVYGVAFAPGTSWGEGQPARWDATGAITLAPRLTPDDSVRQVTGVNAAGDALYTLNTYTDERPRHAWVWHRDGTLTSYIPPQPRTKALHFDAYGISDQGTVVGSTFNGYSFPNSEPCRAQGTQGKVEVWGSVGGKITAISPDGTRRAGYAAADDSMAWVQLCGTSRPWYTLMTPVPADFLADGQVHAHYLRQAPPPPFDPGMQLNNHGVALNGSELSDATWSVTLNRLVDDPAVSTVRGNALLPDGSLLATATENGVDTVGLLTPIAPVKDTP